VAAKRAMYPEQVLDLDRFVVEEVIDGEEFAVDAYFDGEGTPVLVNVLAHRFASADDVSDRVYYTSVDVIDRVGPIALEYLAEIGARAGLAHFPMHAEIRIDASGAVGAVEINPMRFGGWCATDLAYFFFGPFLIRAGAALLLAALGAALDRVMPAGPRALLVSGSNMSGKSTWLRTVGVNVVLAQAGAPVRARRLALTPLRPGATLRIQDSLLAGRSRFYAEITRLKQLADLAAGAPPLLFLLDEILHGTNSHDRRIGAEAVLRELLARGALGLVTTHDLALTALAGGGAGAAPPALANAHFEDQVAEGALAFDYRLRPGVVGHSNALALMRAVGLPV